MNCNTTHYRANSSSVPGDPTSAISGRPAHLPRLTIQNADFAAWQRAWFQGEALEQQLAYWRATLADAPTLELPTDRPRPAIQTYCGARETLAVPAALRDRLGEVARQENATPSMALLGAFATLLHRYSGQDDLTIGLPIANRRWQETESIVGTLINTLVLRVDLSGGPTFRELLQRIQRASLGAYGHQDLPFEQLLSELQPPRDPSRSPLFQVMFDYINTPVRPIELNGLAWEHLPIDCTTSRFDLSLVVADTTSDLRIEAEYNTDLFDAATIQQMLAGLRMLVEEIVTDLDQPIAALPLMATADIQHLLAFWSATDAEYPRDRCLHELIEAQSIRTPDAVAVVFGDEQLTYRELDRRAALLASQLRRLGVSRNSLVGLAVRRSTNMVVGLLGVLKAGGAYVPLDPTYPADRLRYMLEDAGVEVLVTESQLRGSLPDVGLTIVDLDGVEPLNGPADCPEDARAVGPEDLAYVIYTSGSTGRPKGVMISHRAVVNFVCGLDRVLPADPSDVICAVTSMSFDIAVLELLWPLTRGARAVIVDDPLISPTRASTSWTASERIGDTSVCGALQHGTNLLQCTPSMLRLMLHDRRVCDALKHVRLLLLGGEPVTTDLIEDVRRHTSARIFNMYGPTETTVWSAVREIESAEGAGLIGPPFPNTQLYIVDKSRQIVPIGVPGELLIGGDGLSLGYVNRPELTTERFVRDTLGTQSGAYVYRTGDLARYRPNGAIEYLGRLDRLVKLHGYRIELPEIEAVLAQCPGVQESCVIVREDSPGDKRLVAYIVGENAESIGAAQIRRFLRERLPDYMVPAVYVRLDAFPLTLNGKLDVRSLPAPNLGKAHDSSPSRPRTPVEERLARILETSLNVNRVEPTDTFVDLGGHSLLAAEVAAKIETSIGVRINPGLVMFQTLAQLAESCAGAVVDPPPTEPVVAPAEPKEDAPRGGVRGRLLRAARQLLPSARAAQ